MRIEFLIILLAFAIGIYSQFPAFINKYVVNDDIRAHTYWMQQFRDSDLFRNDLLTEYTKYYLPWGFISLYYMLSFIIDPMVFSKFLPIILLALSSLYVFKLLKYITNSNYTGILGALISMISSAFLPAMIGGNPRAFIYPLLFAFLYYLIKKEYLKSSIAMVLQCSFYPTVFLLAVPTYLCSFIKIGHKKISFDKSISKIVFFILAVLVGGSILCTKYTLSYKPHIGTPITRQQMINNPEFYKGGRLRILPTPPLPELIKHHLKETIFGYKNVREHQEILGPRKSRRAIGNAIIFALILFLLFEIVRKKIFFPPEILFLFLSSVLMYKISDLLLLKLFLPNRYVGPAVRIIGIIIFTVAIGQLIIKIKNVRTKRVFQIAVVILVLLNFNTNKEANLIDMSHNKELYGYLSSLPKDAMIAAHPLLADGIPTFALRKVFVKFELSLPYLDNYWETIKKRTFNLFDAYYSENPLSIYRFCEENEIDYLVVDKKHFTKEYLTQKKIYFEPFNTYVVNIAGKRADFALRNIPERDKLFVKDDIFVIKRDVLKHQ